MASISARTKETAVFAQQPYPDSVQEALNPESVQEALRLCKQSFVGVAIFSACANLLHLVPAFFMLNVFDKAVGGNSLPTLGVLSIFALIMFVFMALMEALRGRVLVVISSKLDFILGPAIYDRTFANAVNLGGGEVSTQPLQDLSSLRQFLTGNGVFAFFDAPWLPIYLLVMYLFHPLLGWLGFISSLLLFGIAILNQRSAKDALQESNLRARNVNSETLKALRNAEAAASMGMVQRLKERWRQKQDSVLTYQAHASNVAVTYSAITKTTRLAIQAAAIATGGYLVISQEISPGMLIGGSLLVARALQPVELAVGAWRGFLDAREQFNRLNDVLKNISLPIPRMNLPAIKGHLKAENAVVIPPGSNQPVVNQVSFEVKPGQLALLMGASGAGKSTLVRAVLGLWPTVSGAIRIDGAKSSHFDRQEIGSQLGYLPQDIELFEGSISENIARFTDVDAEAVVQAAKDAGVHEYILALQNGYETMIDQPGGKLSPGQRQRIALARALYKRPKLVILDEPNANLDEAGDNALSVALQTLKQLGSTVLVVSHRQNLLPLADEIIILSEGRVAVSGPAAEVIKKISDHQTQALASKNQLQAR